MRSWPHRCAFTQGGKVLALTDVYTRACATSPSIKARRYQCLWTWSILRMHKIASRAHPLIDYLRMRLHCGANRLRLQLGHMDRFAGSTGDHVALHRDHQAHSWSPAPQLLCAHVSEALFLDRSGCSGASPRCVADLYRVACGIGPPHAASCSHSPERTVKVVRFALQMRSPLYLRPCGHHEHVSSCVQLTAPLPCFSD